MFELVAARYSRSAADAAVDRSGKTVHRRLQRPEARASVRAVHLDRLDQVVGLLGVASVDAAHVVLEELQGPSSAMRLKAAALVLGTFEELRVAGQRDTSADQLEQQIADICAQNQEADSRG